MPRVDDGRKRSITFDPALPLRTAMNESTTTATADDQDLVATTSALILEEKEAEPEPKPRGPFGSR